MRRADARHFDSNHQQCAHAETTRSATSFQAFNVIEETLQRWTKYRTTNTDVSAGCQITLASA